ncbi:MAG: MarR family transcriptional regulator [Chloroflexota bacterium]
MSSSSSESREKLIANFLREIRESHSLGAFFFRAAAAHLGMNATDLQVIDILEITGPSTAGQLAELTGLTTGAITGMIDRLEKSGFVRRENDPNDGRRVLVRLSPSETTMHDIGPLFDSIGYKWDEISSKYDDQQLAFLIDFLKSSNRASTEEIARLRNAPKGVQKDFSIALGDLTMGRLIFSSGASMLNLHADRDLTDLYRAHFKGTLPEVKIEEGVVTIRNRRRLWLLSWGQQDAEIVLNTSIPWQIEIRGGAAGITADLTDVQLTALSVSYGMSSVDLYLPNPSGTVPLRVSGGASDVKINRPAGVPARVRFMGWANAVVFDGEEFGGMRNDLRLQGQGYEEASGRYDIEISGNASMVTISST